MTWTTTGTQSGTDTSLASITTVTGVTVNTTSSGHKAYIVPATITLLTITGTLTWDPDFECLVLSDSTRVEQNAGSVVNIGLLKTVNGKTRYSEGTGLVLNRQQSQPYINTTSCNWWLKASTSLALGAKLYFKGGQVRSGGSIFCGNSTTVTGNFCTLEVDGNTDFQNINGSWTMQMFRCFCEPSGINIYNAAIDGRTTGGLPFSSGGWGTLSVESKFSNYQCDGNGPTTPVTVNNAVFANNVATLDYAYVANVNNLASVNKYVFNNSDVGSGLRTLGQTGTTWRIGCVEITKDVVFNVADTDNTAVENAVSYLKLKGATMNPATGSRYAGIDDYMTPRVYISSSASTGLTPSKNILYAVAQAYATDATLAGTALTMDSLTSRSGDITDGYLWSYGHLVGQPTAAMRGTGTLTQAWTLFDDPNVTLSRTAAIAKLASSFSVNPSTKVVTVTANSTYDDLYDALKAYKCSTTQAQIEAPVIGKTIVTPSGANLTAYTGWSIAVNTGVTLAEGSKFTYIYFDTVTLSGTGKITGIYASTAGTSMTWRFASIQAGSSLIVYDGSGNTKYFQGSVTTAGDYNYYIPPGVSGTYNWAIEKYGKQRESGSFSASTGGLLYYAPLYVEDVGVTQTTQATVAAYTTLETNSKLYDYICYFRLSEQGIKLGQIGTRAGTSIEFGNYSGIVKATHTSVLSISGSTITIKANGLAGDTKYSTIIATPPATWVANTTEVITTNIEDGNGDSSVTISASGVSTFDIWKITDATSPDDYATGTLVASVGVGKWRFLHANGYKFVIRDTTTNYRVVVEAEKGVYSAELFFGSSVQLAQAPEVTIINEKVDLMQVDLEAIKGTGFVKDKHSLTNIKKKAALAAALSA